MYQYFDTDILSSFVVVVVVVVHFFVETNALHTYVRVKVCQRHYSYAYASAVIGTRVC